MKIRRLKQRFILFIVIMQSSVHAGANKILQCFDLLDEKDNYELLSQYHVDNKIQSSDSAVWQPIIELNRIPNNSYAKFSFRKNDKKSDSVRKRIQMNLYEFPSNIDKISTNFKFLFSHELDNLLKSDAKFQWLTLFEIWNDPGWKNKRYPFRISFNLHKNSKENHLVPVITGESKNRKTDEWLVEWKKILNLPITAGKLYSFESKINLSQEKSLKIKLSSKGKEPPVYFERKTSLTHKLNTVDHNIWGINPIKLYTSSKILNLIESQGAKLEVKFFGAEICLPRINS